MIDWSKTPAVVTGGGKTTNAGQFQRKRTELWDCSDWDDGYKDNRGRFRVYRPDYPRAYAEGYALRAHVVWWLVHGEPHPAGTVLHHKNGIKDDDNINNLEVMELAEHTRRHCSLPGITFECPCCGAQFTVPKWRVTQRRKEGHGVKYCSQTCYRRERAR